LWVCCLVLAACDRCSPASGPDASISGDAAAQADAAQAAAPTPEAPGEDRCFTAIADGAAPAQAVFERTQRTGNGDTWHTLIMQVLRTHAQLGAATERDEMGFGFQHLVSYRGQSSWIGYDTEGGAAIFCTPDAGLLQLLRDSYQRARKDPAYLSELIHDVPASEWDD